MAGPWYLADDMASAAGVSVKGLLGLIRSGACPRPDRRDGRMLRWAADREDVRVFRGYGDAATRRESALACIALLTARHGTVEAAAEVSGVSANAIDRLLNDPQRAPWRSTLAKLRAAADA